MAYYAFVDSKNQVVSVISGRDEDEVVEGISDWEAYYSSKRPGLTAFRTSCNTFGGVHRDPETGEPSDDQSKAYRFNFAGLGYTYDEERDAFIPPKPFESWVLDEDTCLWDAPIPMPEDGATYTWNEGTQSWDPVSEA
jgi:hypothetical protein